ncbi:MAG TPA: hypothetical protein VL595_20815 [Pseudonocardia sp.]|jgi:hypothetical protein|nr:hypothetical protein [Pseudonocardia sp.]
MNAAPSETVAPDSTSTDMFEVVWRGYDRDQVEHHMRALQQHLEEEHHRAELAERELRRAENDLANSRQSAGADESQSFGHRVEKILRMAELEAGEIRRKATDEASALMEKARVEAETYRHDAERQMIIRASNLDQEAARRNALIQEREAEVAAELAAAKQRSEEMRSDAEREAERVRKHADALAEETRLKAEKAAQEKRDHAAREVHHLAKIQDEARAAIRRLHEMLAAELGFSSGSAPTDLDESAPERSAAAQDAEEHPAEEHEADGSDD